MKNIFKSVVLLPSCLLGMALTTHLTSCIKYADPAAKFEEYGKDTAVNATRKVLLISMDGVSGEALKTLIPANVDSLLLHSKYTFNTTTDAVSTGASGWKSIMTGVAYGTHKVKDSTFSPNSGGSGWSEESTPYYPSFFSYILQTKPDLNTITITPWQQLSTQLMRESSGQLVTVDDMASKDSAVSQLTKGDPDLLLVDFNGANIAGSQYGYSSTVPQYMSAIKTLDGYIGEIVTALKSREASSKEEWLIMLTTDQGGVNAAGQAQNGFEILNYNSFIEEEVKKSGMSVAVLNGTGSTAVKATSSDPNGTFDLGPVTKKMTISLKINIDAGSYYYPAVFSKRIGPWADNPGWAFFLEGDFWQFNIGQVGMSNVQIKGTTVSDGNWHDIAVVIDYNGSTRTVRTFTDGIFNNQGSITNLGMVTSPADLTAGNVDGDGNVNLRVADVRIFNVALPDSAIVQNTCLKDITKHPFYSNLISYWSCDDGTGSRFASQVTSTYDLRLQNSFSWGATPTFPCNVTPPAAGGADYSIIAQNTDIAANLMYWLRITIDPKWGLQGSAWLDYFQPEFIK